MAILHLDQQCIYRPEKGDRISKGRIYQELNELIQDVPKVVIMHQTPYHDKYKTDEVVEYFEKIIEGNLVVMNSHECARQWGFGTPIIHGLDMKEWGYDPKELEESGKKVLMSKEPRCVIVQSPAGMEKAYRRVFLNQVVRFLNDRKVPTYWIGVDKRFDSFDDYRSYLGRSLIFLHGAWQSPMSRARTEAFLSQCCVVTTPYHGASGFVKSGWYRQTKRGLDITDERIEWDDKTNGFLTSPEEIKDPRAMDSPEYTADLIKYLAFERPDIALEVGRRGCKMAMKLFNKDRYDKSWADFLIKNKILHKNWNK